MTRAEVLQEVRPMKFEEVYTRCTAGKLTQEQAGGYDFGVSVRTVLAMGIPALNVAQRVFMTVRLGKLANNRVPTDTVMEMLTLFDAKWRLFAQAFPREACHPARV